MNEATLKRRIGGLHRLGRRFFPADVLHDSLHDLAASMFGVESLRALTWDQFDSLENAIRGRQELPTARPADRPKRIAPRGRVRKEGVVFAASPAQWNRIRLLVEQLCGGPEALPKEQLVAYARSLIRRVLGDRLAWPDGKASPAELDELLRGVLTSVDAQACINAATGLLKKRGLWGSRRPSGERREPGQSSRRQAHEGSARDSGSSPPNVNDGDVPVNGEAGRRGDDTPAPEWTPAGASGGSEVSDYATRC